MRPLARAALIGGTILAGFAGMLTACQNGAITPQAAQGIAVACQTDAALQPVVVPLAAAVVPQVAAAAALDQALVHPAVLAACAAVAAGAHPVAVVVTPGTVAAPAR